MSLADVGKIKETTVVTLKHPDPSKTLKNPNGEPMTVTLNGPYSTRYKTILREQQQQRMTEMALGQEPTRSAEEVDADWRALIAGCIESWSIWETDKEELLFTPEAALDLFQRHPWIYDQLGGAMGRAGNFFESPEKP